MAVSCESNLVLRRTAETTSGKLHNYLKMNPLPSRFFCSPEGAEGSKPKRVPACLTLCLFDPLIPGPCFWRAKRAKFFQERRVTGGHRQRQRPRAGVSSPLSLHGRRGNGSHATRRSGPGGGPAPDPRTPAGSPTRRERRIFLSDWLPPGSSWSDRASLRSSPGGPVGRSECAAQFRHRPAEMPACPRCGILHTESSGMRRDKKPAARVPPARSR